MVPPSLDYYLFGMHLMFGDGCAGNLPGELEALGCTRPVVLAQKRMAHTDAYRRLLGSLAAFDVLECADVTTHGDLHALEALAPKMAGHHADCIVAIGGGSVSDSAKALALLVAEGGKLADHATAFVPPSTVRIPLRTKPKLPIVSLPTTGSGAEATPSLGIRDGDHKLLFWDRKLACTTVLIDPALSEDIPVALMRSTAFNGLAHCFEAMYSRKKQFLASGLALQAMELLAQALVDVRLDDTDRRWRILLGGHVSGMAMSMARTCLHHAICHVIGASHGLGHGAVNTVVLAHVLRFNESDAIVAADLAPALAVLNRVSGTRHESVSGWVEDALRHTGLPASLSGLGLSQSDLSAIAERTMNERGLALNPVPIAKPDDVLQILRQAL